MAKLFARNTEESISPVNLDQLREEVDAIEANRKHEPRPEDYAPRQVRERPSFTTLQTIAAAVTKLSWKEAEEMGAAINAKLKNGDSITGLTAAIQSWAHDWENFK
jgi:hypothetical protein